MELGRFHDKGLQALHDDDDPKRVPSAMADKLRKLLFALETAESLDQVSRFSRLEAASAQRRTERVLEPNCHWKLEAFVQVRRQNKNRYGY